MQKFLVDGMLGNLARFLRLIGFDSYYASDKTDEELINIAIKENRLILTRDLELSKIKAIKSIYIKSLDLKQQIKQIIDETKIKISKENFFSLCLECNNKLEKIEKEKIREKVPLQSYNSFNEFYICKGCKKIYWKGTHYTSLLEKIKQITSDL